MNSIPPLSLEQRELILKFRSAPPKPSRAWLFRAVLVAGALLALQAWIPVWPIWLCAIVGLGIIWRACGVYHQVYVRDELIHRLLIVGNGGSDCEPCLPKGSGPIPPFENAEQLPHQ